MYVTIVNTSSILKYIFQRSVYKRGIGLLTVTCTVLFVAIRCIKKLNKRKQLSAPRILSDMVKPSEIIVASDDELCAEAVDKLVQFVSSRVMNCLLY